MTSASRRVPPLFPRIGALWCLVVAVWLAAIAGQAQAQTGSQVAFDIPAQPIDQALLLFSEQSGLALVAVGDLGDAVRAPAIRGRMTSRTALRRLLAGSGLQYEFRPHDVVTVSRAPTRAVHAATPARSHDVVDLSSVLVTARKRDEHRVDVPLTVTAIDGPRMDALGLDNIVDVISTVPAASSIDTGGGFTQVQIRGVSSSLGGNDNGYYLDEIPFTGVTVPWYPDARAFDLDRVEVLRGPQGTLFGEGSMGGTVRILTRRPDSSGFAARALLSASSTDGGGNGVGGKAMVNLPLLDDRLAMRVVATDERLAGWVDDPDSGLHDLNAQRVRTGRVRLRFSPNADTDINVGYWRYASGAPGGGYTALDNQQLDVLYGRESDWSTRSLVIEHRLPDSSLIYAVAGADLRYDAAGQLAPTSDYRSHIGIDVLTQELRWSSSGARALDWTLGAYLRDATRKEWAIVGLLPMSAQRQRNAAYALFGEASYQLPAQRWSLLAGLRYFNDDVDALSRSGDRQVALDAGFSSWNPRLGVSYRSEAGALLYANVARGFRSGQLQPASSLLVAESEGVVLPTAIDPDSIVSVELGARHAFADGRVLLEGALFHSNWRDVAVRVPLTPTINGLRNSAGVTSRGAEFALAYAPAPSVSLQLSGSLVDATYAEAVPGTTLERGSNVYNVPRASLAGTAGYSWPMRGGLLASTQASLRYDSARNVSLTQGSPGDSILFASARVGVQSPHGWGVYLFGENLTNDDGAVDARNIRGAATRLRPRTLGIAVDLRY